MSKKAQYKFTCDGCGKIAVAEEGEIPKGFHGVVYEMISDGGGIPTDWYACKSSCLNQAILAAISVGWGALARNPVKSGQRKVKEKDK